LGHGWEHCSGADSAFDANRAPQFDVGGFTVVLDPVLFCSPRRDQLASMSVELPELPDMLCWNEATLQYIGKKQFGDPFAILLIGLLPRNILDVAGIDQQNVKVIFQNRVNRSPINTGALHR